MNLLGVVTTAVSPSISMANRSLISAFSLSFNPRRLCMLAVCNYLPIWAIFVHCPFGQFLNIPIGQYCPYGQFLGANFFSNFDHFQENQIPHGAANLRKKRSPQLDSPQKIKGISFPPRIHLFSMINSLCTNIMYFDLHYVLI